MLGICCVYMCQALFNTGQEHSDFGNLSLVCGTGAWLPCLSWLLHLSVCFKTPVYIQPPGKIQSSLISSNICREGPALLKERIFEGGMQSLHAEQYFIVLAIHTAEVMLSQGTEVHQLLSCFSLIKCAYLNSKRITFLLEQSGNSKIVSVFIS